MQAFGSEQIGDELAYAAKIDPIEFRRMNISDDQWLTALNAAAAATVVAFELARRRRGTGREGG